MHTKGGRIKEVRCYCIVALLLVLFILGVFVAQLVVKPESRQVDMTRLRHVSAHYIFHLVNA